MYVCLLSRVGANPSRIFLEEFCSVLQTCIASTAFLLLRAKDARWSQQRLFPGELTAWVWGVGTEGWQQQATALQSGQCSAIRSRCSINSGVLTCHLLCDAWRRIRALPGWGFPGWGVTHHASIAKCSVFPSISLSQLCPRISFWNMFLFSTLQKPFLCWSHAKTLGTGKYPEICKDKKNNLCTWKFLVLP